jgi:hypothetical protein
MGRALVSLFPLPKARVSLIVVSVRSTYFLAVLRDRGVLVVDAQARGEAFCEDPRAEPSRGGPQPFGHKSAAEDQPDPVGAPGIAAGRTGCTGAAGQVSCRSLRIDTAESREGSLLDTQKAPSAPRQPVPCRDAHPGVHRGLAELHIGTRMEAGTVPSQEHRERRQPPKSGQGRGCHARRREGQLWFHGMAGQNCRWRIGCVRRVRGPGGKVEISVRPAFVFR